MTLIKPMLEKDIDSVAEIHRKIFVRQLASKKWVSSNFNAYPRIIMFVAVSKEHEIIGYIQWLQKSGFRKESVIELEQIGVLPNFQKKGIGSKLIYESLKLVNDYLLANHSTLKAIIVTTRSDNAAKKIYTQCLGANVISTIKNQYSADEVIMLASYPNNNVQAIKSS